MIGAIIGDIVGSRFEWNNHLSKEFELLPLQCFFTDDSVMSLAICDALMRCQWMYSDNPEPYNSFGNGAAMRVSGCGYAARSLEEAKALSKAVTEVTHNHPEGLKGAESVAVAVFLARTGKNRTEIREHITKNYYPIDFTMDSIRGIYSFNETCQNTVPQALEAFFESDGFEDAIRNAISVGGDSDTLAAITGAVAEAYYGTPDGIRKKALTFLDERLLKILLNFERIYPVKPVQGGGDM